MSTAVIAHPRVTQGRLLRSEWTKLRSLRSTRWSLLAAFVAMAAGGIVSVAVSMSQWSQLSAHERSTFDSVDTVPRTRAPAFRAMIHASLMAAPRRLPVLWAKIGVFAAVTFVLMLLASAISFFAVQLIASGHDQQHAIGSKRQRSGGLQLGLAFFESPVGSRGAGGKAQPQHRTGKDLSHRSSP